MLLLRFMKKLLFVLACSTLSMTALADRPPGKGRRGPPPEAVEACVGKQANDACAFEGRRGAVEGVCFRPEASLPLACRPTRRDRQ